MPSWNEKPVIIPEINVNLKSCTCATRDALGDHPGHHSLTCSGRRVPIPCPIPRSVVFTVTLGECTCPNGGRPPEGHWRNCPGRPIRVACSIRGETWAKSEVTEVDVTRWEIHPDDYETRFLATCRERWALVKALVLNGGPVGSVTGHQWVALSSQRDAVFAALCEMARAEEIVFRAQADAQKAFLSWPSEFIPDRFMDEEPHSRPSASILAQYVEHLIEQVGVLGVAS